MVAYSFHRCFEGPIVAYRKLQTVRAHRRRHARPDEPVQIFTGMRTSACRKLLDPDPICTAVLDVRFKVPALRLEDEMAISINGVALDRDIADQFALYDGFGDVTTTDGAGRLCGATAGFGIERILTPLQIMTAWWIDTHGVGNWDGVCVRWRQP